MEIFNAADFLVDRHVRAGVGDHLAVLTPERTLTSRQLADEVHQVAAGFGALGVRPEERIVFCMADGIELLSGILAALHVGAVPVPVSTMVTGDELATMVVDARARVLCVSVEFADAASAALAVAPEVEHVVLDGEAALGVPARSWSELRAAGTRPDGYPTWPDSPALLYAVTL